MTWLTSDDHLADRVERSPSDSKDGGGHPGMQHGEHGNPPEWLIRPGGIAEPAGPFGIYHDLVGGDVVAPGRPQAGRVPRAAVNRELVGRCENQPRLGLDCAAWVPDERVHGDPGRVQAERTVG